MSRCRRACASETPAALTARARSAFSARAPQTGCPVEWSPATSLFVDICDDTTTFAPNGDGLEQYPVVLENTKLLIDINYADRGEHTP